MLVDIKTVKYFEVIKNSNININGCIDSSIDYITEYYTIYKNNNLGKNKKRIDAK